MARRGREGTSEENQTDPLLPVYEQHASLEQVKRDSSFSANSSDGEKPPSSSDASDTAKTSSDIAAKISAAAFYAIASLSTVFVMKLVLTSYGFPSALFLGLCQFVLTTVVFSVLALLGCVSISAPSIEIISRVAPLTIIFLFNVVTGLGGTKEISLPMFTVLRRFSILFTMLLEAYVFDKTPAISVKVSVAMMLGGAMVAAVSDLSFHAHGAIVFVFLLMSSSKIAFLSPPPF